ncbi:putative metal-binding protein, possibly nucleic-acid binding protein [Halobacteroides halobius DSM 5150]|uniref:Putative metal-binding protein, possibly nucleic-acid binding protein n=1 Tax=Halobacteroides halobius (strain ATCC 35273 / DSM 5150 / MD-1) TaxID=748449 RepID=L0KA21_HALHC|nr:DUF177 domain-containing protein [Halobacteroides halobius]AGB41370.1 putative metal-binding protein, possibly nucleic-acid binding protein [Halobacteroides halobius DSM 5150]
MKINIKSIKDTLGAKIDVKKSINLESRKIRGQEIEFIGSCELDLMVINAEDKYVVSGPGKVLVKLPCSRCLEEVKEELNFNFNEEIKKVDVEHNELDLSNSLEEYIRLSLPMQVVCDEDCAGLCPSCGINLNDDECECYMHEVDPRLAKLDKLLDD